MDFVGFSCHLPFFGYPIPASLDNLSLSPPWLPMPRFLHFIQLSQSPSFPIAILYASVFLSQPARIFPSHSLPMPQFPPELSKNYRKVDLSITTFAEPWLT